MPDKTLTLKGYQDYTNPENDRGLPMHFATNERGVSSQFTIPAHMGGWRTSTLLAAHPGAVDTVLSTVMGRTAIARTKKAALIKSFSVEYLDFVPTDKQLQCEARVVGAPGAHEAVLEGRILDENKKLLAKSVGTYSLFSMEELSAPQGTAWRSTAVRCSTAALQQFESMTKGL